MIRFLADALRFYFEFHARYDGFYGAFVHDPLVVAAALDPALVTTEPVAVEVDASGGPGDGQTIGDWRHVRGRTPNADVAVAVDAAEFGRRLVERVGALAAASASIGQVRPAPAPMGPPPMGACAAPRIATTVVGDGGADGPFADRCRMEPAWTATTTPGPERRAAVGGGSSWPTTARATAGSPGASSRLAAWRS